MIEFKNVAKKFKADAMPFWLLGVAHNDGVIASNLTEKDLTKSLKLLKANLDLLEGGMFILQTSIDKENIEAGHEYNIYPASFVNIERDIQRKVAETAKNGVEEFLYLQRLGTNTHLRLAMPNKEIKIVKLDDIDSFNIKGEEVNIKGKGLNQRLHLKDVGIIDSAALLEELHWEAPQESTAK